jgi:hypothetical protein
MHIGSLKEVRDKIAVGRIEIDDALRMSYR